MRVSVAGGVKDNDRRISGTDPALQVNAGKSRIDPMSTAALAPDRDGRPLA
jgi:hypothetical protein